MKFSKMLVYAGLSGIAYGYSVKNCAEYNKCSVLDIGQSPKNKQHESTPLGKGVQIDDDLDEPFSNVVLEPDESEQTDDIVDDDDESEQLDDEEPESENFYDGF
jgi:hypothetical protein